MKNRAQIVARMGKAFDNYFDLTELLRQDLEALLDFESKSAHWRRNFVRAATSLFEGHAYGLRQMCKVVVSVEGVKLTSKELKVLRDEAGFSTEERIKLTLRAAYKAFGISPTPSFDGPDWGRAKRLFQKRHKLMHPTNARFLGMSDTTWRELKKGAIWLMSQFFNFLSQTQSKYGS